MGSNILAKSKFRLSFLLVKLKWNLSFQSVKINRNNWESLGHGPFNKHKVMFVMSDPLSREVYQRILLAGGGEVQEAALHQAIRRGFKREDLTHIIADPSILDPGHPRYREFQQWLSYEKNLNEEKNGSGRSDGDGGIWKVFYTFLVYKLTFPHKKNEEAEFSIFLKKIQKEALARARLGRQIKIKREAEEAEAEVIILKEKLVKRNPGRTYRDQSRGGTPHLGRPKLEQKREAEWEEGISGGRKRARNWSGLSLFAQFAQFF